ncbi:glycosyltransferase family 4 protein [Flavobacterium restrictum]|uniref:Glycosyltransferase family 4 protein n=1 Tax=Flavobacterium restrictum TaxID=2594428 RepID=A0A553E8E8_9FLAO|nr:glycosyltransferase family 4 protein [Flavobacterium restrictum]TRX41262.1 glycosyltransferase family 4 protein [Flavobacterium restrictum]
MHVCYLTNEYPKPGYPHGGIGSFVKTVAAPLAQRGYQVSVIGINYTADQEELLEDGVHIYRIKKEIKKGWTWWHNFNRISKKIAAIHQEQPISIVETSELGLAFLKKAPGIKYVIRLHGGHHFFAESEDRKVNFWKGWQEKRSFRKADAFVAVSNYVKTHTENYLSYHNKEVTLISYPINTSLFQPLGIPIVKHQIAFAGTVCKKKGIVELIRAFELVNQKFPKATLMIYGRDWLFPNGESFIRMLKQTEMTRLGTVADAITFVGPVAFESIPVKYAQAEVCVFPSHMETQGLVAPEAMAMGKAVVFTQLGPGPETIVDLETGLLCDPYSPADIAKKIVWVFENQLAAATMGNKAKDFVTHKYGLETILEKNINFYNAILD